VACRVVVKQTGPGWGACWPAPAKINLFLHILGRRDDGYHDLQTAFQFLDYCDDIVIDRAADGEISRSGGLPGLQPGNDLAVKAAILLKEVTDCPYGARISIRKRIPAGGGLGGGSSDAATVLIALNVLWELGLNLDVLQGIGQQLGADVPVFLRGRAAWAEGIGERLSPMEFQTPCYMVIKPACDVSTRRVFQSPELTRNSPPITISGFLSSGGRNDCLPLVSILYPEVAEAFEWLSDQQLRLSGDRQADARGSQREARLTGTGACVFAGFDNEFEAKSVFERLPQRWSGFVARGVNVSPLLRMTGRDQ
jgi:4-diphosphocytidyl-2-C-methyl-D-erythritol kinase